MESELRPRVCYLTKGERGYGFHLHGERNKGGQFIRKVEPGSSADLAGLRPGDRVVEVNGENVENETHHQVVNRIREVAHRTRLLVVDRDTDDHFRRHGLACTEDLAIEMGTLSPRPSPKPAPCTSPLPKKTLSPKPNHTHSFHRPAAGSPTQTITQGKAKRSSETSSTATDTEAQLSPEPTAELLPRLCHLVKGEKGYGFNLHSDKTKGGQFVRSVDPGSAAESADIRLGDRLVEVNGVNIEGLRHSEVVALIRAGGEEVRLLVVDQETDELFHTLGITPATSHDKEVYVEESATESASPTPSPTSELPATGPPIINVTLTDSPNTDKTPKSRANRSSASSRSSTTQSEISSSVPDENDRRVSDPFIDSGLRLSPTAAEAKQKALANRNKKRAPPMDWSKRQEIFSNF
ncbi:Na(+)/H(+) exchange regulatory cofactor NHE-RF2-like [Micropterus salmoides]|uniref:Na(+)/H(+) exchange regulatory cofactor NHE-RF2-like n=1 Tax=Micropterus salmoides TaxID=27706 RepID=UPI0018EAF01C|nr:Na(+)/H(+) exchange regulatory cofactor NHE-RF2-like [Micropterus salmoides]